MNWELLRTQNPKATNKNTLFAIDRAQSTFLNRTLSLFIKNNAILTIIPNYPNYIPI